MSRGAAAFSPQAQCNLAWASAAGGVAAPALLDAVADEGARTRLRGFTTQAVANTAWSFASAAHAAPELFVAMAEQIERMPLDRYRPHELALLAWAFAAADVPCDALCGERFVSHLGRLEWTHGAQLAMLHQCAHRHRYRHRHRHRHFHRHRHRHRHRPAAPPPPPCSPATAIATATALQPRLGRGCNPTHPSCNHAPLRYALWADEREARGEGAALPRLPQPLLERAAAAFAGDSEAGDSDAGGPKAGVSKAGDLSRRKAAAANSRSDGGSETRMDDSSLQLQVCSRAWAA